MSTTIDQKVVEMRFDNKQFESATADTMSTLDKLKQKLNLTGASKGLEDIDSAAKRVDMSGLGSGIDAVRTKFSALSVMGVTAIANITNSAVNAGKKIVSALTIDPVKTGFQEYETQINAVQTILANTQSKGTTIDQVNKALDELNMYADKTIYNFTQMTRNIGTFTAAGIDLDTSVSAIQGIANLAAVSGSTSQQASTAMYQLSQALASGTVKLMDWNSVVNAGMGGQLFQDALKKTAETHGVNVDAIIKKEGSFRESLKEGWITSEVLTETLSKMTKSGAAEYLSKLTSVSNDQIKAAQEEADKTGKSEEAYKKLAKQLAETGKISEKEALETLKMADSAEDAATKVKTFTQLWDTLKEAAQSGWTQSWEIIIGDFEEAKELLTSISDTIGPMINKMSDARNKLLQGWKDAGGRTMLIESLKNAFEGVLSVVEPAKEAFREILPPLTVKNLMNFTEGIKNFTEKLKLSSEAADKFKRVFKGVFSIFDIARKAITTVTGALFNLSGSKGIKSVSDFILDIAARIGDFFTSLNEGIKTGDISGWFSKFTSTFSESLDKFVSKLDGFKEKFSYFSQNIATTAIKIKDVIKKAFSWLADNVSVGEALTGAGMALGGSGIFAAITKLISFFKGLFGKDSSKKTEKFKSVIDSVKDSLTSFTNGVKVSSLVAIAAAIGILTWSLSSLSELNVYDASQSLFAIGAMITMLVLGFKSLTKSLKAFDSKGIVKSAFSLILIAVAVKVLASAMAKFSALSLDEIGRGLTAMGGALLEMAGMMALLKKAGGGSTLSGSISLVIAVLSLSKIASGLKEFSTMSWDEITRGLAAMGLALAEMAGTMALLKKIGGGSSLVGSIGLVIAVLSLGKMASGLKEFSTMSWSEIGRGLAAMGGALLEMAGIMLLVGKIGGISSIIGALAIDILVSSLDKIVDAMIKFGSMSLAEIGRGLAAMGGALVELGGVITVLGLIFASNPLAALGGYAGVKEIGILTGFLDTIADAMIKFGSMSWSEVGRSLTAMGVALVELGGVIAGVGLLSIGGLTMKSTVKSIGILIGFLDPLADAMIKFGSMSWGEVGRGLTAMGVALTELGGITSAIGLLSIGGLLAKGGTNAITGVVGSLGKLADAMIKFGSMSWGEVGRGLTAMGGALAEISIGGLLNTFSGIGSNNISNAAKPLNDIAKALGKFGSMSWDQISRGLTAMKEALSEVAIGGLLNTFSGIGAGGISKIAEPLGKLADSVKKWTDVTVPANFGENLGMLASGVRKFLFTDFGASNISEIAGPLGTLGESVKKWTGVTVPANFGENIAALAAGVRKFFFTDFAARNISEIAGPLGELADSVKKWNGVTASKELGSRLGSLSEGIKKFEWLFLAGWSLGALVKPLSELPDSIQKWNDISLPANVKTDLEDLSEGVKKFEWLFLAGWSLNSLAKPLGELPNSLKEWNGVEVPESIKTSLINLSDGVKSFSWAFLGKWSITSLAGAVSKLADSAKAWNDINISDTGRLKEFSDNIKYVSETKIEGLNAFSDAVFKFNNAICLATSLNSKAVDSFVSAITKIGKIDIDTKSLSFAASSMYSSVNSMMTSINSAIENSKSSVESSMKHAISGITSAIKSSNEAIKNATIDLVLVFTKAIISQKEKAISAFKSIVSGAVSAVRSEYKSMRSAGEDFGNGLVVGIVSKKNEVYRAGFDLGAQAVQGEKDGQNSNSPSKDTIKAGKWLGEGVVIGVEKMGDAVYNAGYRMGNTATKAISSAISRISDVLDSDMDMQPTIRPVLDLSDIRNNAGSISSMLDLSPAMANAYSVSSIVGHRQNASNDEVISAIKDLKSVLGTSSGDTYIIDGITYDDGSGISTAVKEIVRAARVERRT